MSLLTSLINQACTITTTSNSTEDVFGDPTQATTTTTTVCYVEQRQTDETTAGLAVGDERWRGIFPAGTAITARDRVTVGALVFEVDGPPWPARNPSTRVASHVEANLRRTK